MESVPTLVSPLSFSPSWREAAYGKSIGRVLINNFMKTWCAELKGRVLDLACGKNPSYWRLSGIHEKSDVELITGDYNPDYRPQIVLDMNRPLPFADEYADAAIIASFLYIAEKPGEVLKEARRVLKPGGTLILTAPLIFPHTPEPMDYWRFTEESLRHMLKGAGFNQLEIHPLGDRCASALYLLSPFLRPVKFFIPFLYWVALKTDQAARRYMKHWPPCPIGYVVRAKAA